MQFPGGVFLRRDAKQQHAAQAKLHRLPGLFRRWELNDVIELGADFHLEDAGEAADGTQLIAVYRRERRSTRNTTTDSSSTTNPNKKEQ